MTSKVEFLAEDGMQVAVLGQEYDNLDAPAIETAAKQLLELAQSADPPLVVVDMQNTKFFGSAFLGVLFRMWRRLTTCSRGLKSVKRVIAQLDVHVIEVKADVPPRVLRVVHLDDLGHLAPGVETEVDLLEAGVECVEDVATVGGGDHPADLVGLDLIAVLRDHESVVGFGGL
mgnify:CR=1 FL=1